MSKPLDSLMRQYTQPGEIVWIGIRPDKKADMISVESVLIDTDSGLAGDHYAGRSGNRQVTLIQAEHILAVASMLGRDKVEPEELRRNIVIRGINLLALKDKEFQLGNAVLEYTGLCHPCSRMEKNLGVGGYNAMRGHGGINARVIVSGEIAVGDICSPLVQQ